MLRSLQKIIETVTAATTLDKATATLVYSVKNLIQADVASLFIMDYAQQRYLLIASDGLNESSVGSAQLEFTEGLVGMIAAREEPFNTANAKRHPQFRYLEQTGEDAFSAFLGVPIIHKRQVLGVLVAQRVASQKFSSTEESLLLTVASQIASVLAGFESRHAAYGLNFAAADPQTAKYDGTGASVGVGIGKAWVIIPPRDFSSLPDRLVADSDSELDHFKSACAQVRLQLEELHEKLEHQFGQQDIALLKVYTQMLEDPAFVGEIETLIMSGLWAPSALKRVVQHSMAQFEAIEDDYIRERMVDVKDIGYRLLACLHSDDQDIPNFDEPVILIGDEISATLLMEIPREKLCGVISAKGTSNAHMAIIARAIELPAVVGLNDLHMDQLDGQLLVVDGHAGKIYVNPSDNLRENYQSIIEGQIELNECFMAEVFRPTQTKCGESLNLFANTGMHSDAKAALHRSAQGVGLFRTEICFMGLDRFPSEVEQQQMYRKHLEVFAPMPVTMRTLDIGGDKSLPYFPIIETNPVLGWRGIRVTLDHPEIFMVQIRAMLKASEGLDNLQILLPMIANIREIEDSLLLIRRAYYEVLDEGFHIQLPKVGVMIEVPAALYQIKAFAELVDFFSIGTNDLIQYLLAVDRNNPKVAGLFQAYHPAVLKTLADLYQSISATGLPVSLCGEAAGDPGLAILFAGMGYRNFSMSPSRLLAVKWAFGQMKLAQMKALWEKVAECDDASEVEKIVMTRLGHYGLLPAQAKSEPQKAQASSF